MKTQCLSLDRISTLPNNIIEKILTLMPIRDALRTSILSKKWRYSWRSMPKLVFNEAMVEVQPNCCFGQLEKYKLVNAILHVLLLHNGPTILELGCRVRPLDMDTEFIQISSFLAIGKKVKEMKFFSTNFYKLPGSFFSLQGLEVVELRHCALEPPLTFNGFSLLKRITFFSVDVSAKMLQRFLSKCPLLEHISLDGFQENIDLVAGGNMFTFVDLLQCVPLIRTLDISVYYMKYLSAGCMPPKLPTSLVRLENLYFDLCLLEQNEISSALCMIRSSPFLVKIIFRMWYKKKLLDQQTPANFLDLHSDLMLDHLEILEIEGFNNLPIEMEFVKLVMAKSPVLKKVQILLRGKVSVDEEMKMLRDMVRVPFPRASPSAELVIRRP